MAFIFRVYNSTGELYLHYCGWSGAEFSLNYFLRPGMRYQIVLAYDNEQLIIYINGVVWWKAKLQNAAMPTVSKLGVLNRYDGNYRADKSIMNFLQIRKGTVSRRMGQACYTNWNSVRVHRLYGNYSRSFE